MPQKADMPWLRGAGAMGGDRQLRGHPDRAGTEHMQQFSSSAPTHTFSEHALDLQRQREGLVGKCRLRKESTFYWGDLGRGKGRYEAGEYIYD